MPGPGVLGPEGSHPPRAARAPHIPSGSCSSGSRPAATSRGSASPRSSPFSTRGPGRSPAATPQLRYLRRPWPCVLCALILARTTERRHRAPQPRPAPAATVLTSSVWTASVPALGPTPSAPPRRPLVGAPRKRPEAALGRSTLLIGWQSRRSGAVPTSAPLIPFLFGSWEVEVLDAGSLGKSVAEQ